MAITELEAVNVILATAGEMALSSLSPGTPSSVAAQAALNEATRDIFNMGETKWNVRHVTLTPNGADKLLVDTNVVRAYRPYDSDQPGREYAIQSDLSLYDPVDRVDTFSGDTVVVLVYRYSFTQCPEPAQIYAMRRAARAYLQRSGVDPSQIQHLQELEYQAAAALEEYDARFGYTYFGDKVARFLQYRDVPLYQTTP